MAEGQKAAETDQQVERAREERETQRLHQEDRIDAEHRRERQRRRHDGRRDQHHPRARNGSRGRRNRHAGPYFSLPNSPAGLRSSTMTMITKTTVFDASG